MKTGRYSGYADPFLAAGFTSAADMSLRATMGREVQAASASMVTSLLLSVLDGGGMSGRFNFGVGTGGGDEPNGYRRLEGA